MKSKTLKKLVVGLMLTVFGFSNTALTTLAYDADVNYATGVSKPVLRDSAQPKSSTVSLKGDVSITKKNTPVTISLRDSDVTQVLRMFADKAGLNIIFQNSVKGTVTLDLVGVPLNSAFEMVMEISDLTYLLEGNTLIIAPAKLAGFNMAKQEMTTVPVKYVDASTIAAFLNKNIYGAGKAGISGTDVVVTNPATNELLVFGNKNQVAIARKMVEQFDKKPETNVFKVNHTTPAEMANMICSMLLPGALGKGGGGSSGGAGGGAPQGTPTGGASSASDGASSGSSGGSGGGLTLNGGTMACSYNTAVDAGGISSLGMQNLAVAYYTSLGTVSVIGGSESQVEMIKGFIEQTDKKQPQAYLEVSIVELSESGSKTLDNTWQVWSKYFSASFSNGGVRSNPIYPTFFKGSQFDVIDSESLPDVLYTIKQYTDPAMISYAINYLIENKKGRIVANPRILITNGQESTIDLTSDYVKSVDEQILSNGGGLAGGVQRTYDIASDNGIKVNITPFISPDGYVTLNIAPDYSTIKEKVYTSSAVPGGAPVLAATLLQRRNLDLKNVRIKDGETLVIGGMIREEETKTISKIPFLGDIPGLGMFFRSTTTGKAKEEMVIMITPKIITDTEDAISKKRRSITPTEFIHKKIKYE